MKTNDNNLYNMKGEIIHIEESQEHEEDEDEEGPHPQMMRDKISRFVLFLMVWGTSIGIFVFCMYVLLSQFGII